MLSVVSVISVNLVASLAMSRVDSTRAGAASSSAPDVVRAVALDERTSVERRVIATASRYLGTRYRLGGTKPNAFDCSGFVRYVFARHGVSLPRTAREQSTAGNSIVMGLDSLQVGDLLFFESKRGPASHVAIYVGNGEMVHAPSSGKSVRRDRLDSPYWKKHLSEARRVTA